MIDLSPLAFNENGGWDAFDMVELERYKATDKRNLHTRERYYIELLKPSLNHVVPIQSKQEWTQIHKNEITQYKDIWYKKNKVEIQQQSLDYRNNHKTEISQQNKQYRKANKESISAYKKTRINCICGAITAKGHVSRHMKSDKCIYNQIYNFIHS